MTSEKAYNNWEDYVKILNAKFASQGYVDPIAKLINQRQTDSLQEHMNAFDRLFLWLIL